MPFTEVYLALQTRTVDGQENPVTLIWSSKFHEVQKHLSLTRHAYTVSIVAMNLARFRALSPVLQKTLVEAAREAATFQRQLNRDTEGEALAKMKQAGLAVIENIDAGPFRAVLGDKIRQTYVEKFGADLVSAIEGMRR
jgi:TRAP-type C4-dicarboxylate transport system substrate-binding protein